MNKISKRKVLLIVAICVTVLVVAFLLTVYFSLKNFLPKEYYDDIHIPLKNHRAELIIKEWHWLHGSGAEIYYKAEGKRSVLVGQTSTYDGYRSFTDGKYEIEEQDNSIKISWAYRRIDDRSEWQSQTLEIPD